MGTPTPYGGTPMYQIPEEERTQQFDVPKELEGLPEMKPEDKQYFGKLLKEVSRLLRFALQAPVLEQGCAVADLCHDTRLVPSLQLSLPGAVCTQHLLYSQ